MNDVNYGCLQLVGIKTFLSTMPCIKNERNSVIEKVIICFLNFKTYFNMFYKVKNQTNL